MDYDDNDFASQNSQIVGDEGSKFPTGLHSYVLPKFDLDEHLQVHLRYDSLGETGLLPDIASETEDHWIEDYSREASSILELDPVSHTIGFGVNAEESCTISRNNNVWSEAASSESVEMLLNSVEQDEMIMDKHNIALSDSCDALDKVGEQMNSGACQDDSPHYAKRDPLMDTVVPPDNPHGNSPSLDKDASEDVAHVESMLDLQGSKYMLSNTLHKSETSIPNSSSKTISVEGKSSNGNEVELLSVNCACTDELVHTKHLEPPQAESMFPSEDSFHFRSVVLDEMHSISAIPNEVISEKLVNTPKVSPPGPTTQCATVEIDAPIGDACNKVSSEGLQGTDMNFNANVVNEKISCEDPDVNYYLMDNEFVHKNNCVLGETHLLEEKTVVLMDSILVQQTLGDASEGIQDCLKSNIDCSEIPKTNTQVGGRHLDSTGLQGAVSVELALSEVQNTSEVILEDSPMTSNVENRVGDVQSPGSGSENASQANAVAAHADMNNVVPEDLAKKDASTDAPEDLAKKDAIQHEIVGSDAQTTENVVYESMSCVGITVQFDPGRVGVVAGNISGNASQPNVAALVDMGKVVPEDLTKQDASIAAPEDLAKKDAIAIQHEIVVSDAQTTENVVYESMSCAGITVAVDQFDPGRVEVVSGNISENASQPNVAARVDVRKVVPEDLTKQDASIAVPEDLAKKDAIAIQHEIVVSDAQTTENVVYESMSCAGITVAVDQFDPGRVEVVSGNISENASQPNVVAHADMDKVVPEDLTKKDASITAPEDLAKGDAIAIQHEIVGSDTQTRENMVYESMSCAGITVQFDPDSVEVVSGNISENASQPNVAAHVDMGKVVPEELTKIDASTAASGDLAKKDSIQHERVASDTQTTENVAYESMSCAGITIVLDQFDPDRIEVVSGNISDIAVAGVSEGSVCAMVVNENSMKCEDLQQKEHTSVALASRETTHRELVDGECWSVNLANLSACNAAANGAQLPTSESGSLTGSTGKNQEGEACTILSEETPCDHSAMVIVTDSPVDLKAISEDSIMSSEENPCECLQRTDKETFSFASPTTDALKSSTVDSKASADAVKDIMMSNLVDASKPAKDVACGRDSVKNDADTSKTGSDIASYAEPDCGSPTIISCSGACIGDGRHEDGAKDSTVPSPSGGVSCSPLDIPGHSDKQIETEQTLGGIDMPESDKSFTFEVGKVAGSCVDERTAKGWKPFLSVKPVEIFQSNDKGSEVETSQVSQSPKVQSQLEVRKDQSRGKSRSRSGSSGTGRVTSGKGKATKEPSSARTASSPLPNGESPANTSVSPGSPLVSSSVQAKEIKKMAYVEGSATKSFSVATAQLPNLTDFNALATPVPAVFQKPFTDMQQLQLRAQIFVYGSLMQGTAPDEACMASAFGESGRDGGRSTWESIWHLAVERTQNQKSWATNPEISPLSFSGMRTCDQASWGNSVQSKSPPTSACKTAANCSSVLNPAVPSSSPLWSMSTPSRDVLHASSVTRALPVDTHMTLTPVQVYPFSTLRSFGGHNSPWSTHASGPVPWVLSTQIPALDAGSSYGTLSKQEVVRATPDQDQTVVVPAIHSSSQTVASSSVSSGLVLSNIHTDSRTTPATGRQPSTEQKSRRRKNMPHELAQPLCIQTTPTESASPAETSKNTPPCSRLVPATTSPFSSVVSACEAALGDPTLTKPPMASLTEHQMVSVGNTERGLVILEETFSQIDQAKLQAEDALAIASSSVRHSQEMWRQVSAQKNSGLVVDIEQRLASAAASVAKAAAAAAKVASDAAFQAKLMVDEALTTNKVDTIDQGTQTNILEGRQCSVQLAPAFKGKENQGISTSVIEFAKEAARKRVEAASAAAKRAQNLGAVVKAAELVAEAVSQVTLIIGMDDPIPLTLNELLEAGPKSYWKHQETSNLYAVRNKTAEVALTSGKDSGNPNDMHEKALSRKDVTQSYGGRNDERSKEPVILSIDNRTKPVSAAHSILPISELVEIHKQTEKPSGASNSATTLTSGSIHPLELESRDIYNRVQSGNYENHGQRSASTVNPIELESLVEVISEEEGLRSVWFSATVLEIKDGSAYVCYKDILSAEGTSQRKEWIPLGISDGKPPRIRIPHPMTAMKFEGTRKRRRSTGNCNWSSGDHVDVWIRDGWWEGVITEKSVEDETKLTVRFPVKGDIRTVRAWNLRPSLVWKDDQWVEWSRQNCGWLNEGDAPLDKRQKLDGNLENNAPFKKEEKNLSNAACSDSITKLQESIPLDLQPKDKMFSVGKSGDEANNLAVGRVKRTGLQTEGSRVIFGVPKPGKKRKFMDVSKHYDGPRIGKAGEVNSEPKFARYLMSTRSSGLRGPSRGDVKGDRLRNAPSKDVKELKPQGRQGRGRSEKVSSASVGADVPDVQPSLSHESQPGKPNRMESSSEVPRLTSVSGPFSSMEQRSGLPMQRNKSATTDHRPTPKVRIGSANRNLSSDEKASAVSAQVKPPDSVEPRRSNRRIQPTSRLLEGLQSSLAIGKVSSSGLHEKGSKSSNKNR